MTCRNPFSSPPLEKLTTGLYATSPTPTKKPMRLSGPTWTKSPLFDGTIQGVGPRYCPSIETKLVRFPDKPRHQIL